MNKWLLVALLIAVVGAAAALLWILWRQRKRAAAAAAGTQPPPNALADAQYLVREAAQRLSASSRPPIPGLPVVLVVGDTGAAKTSIILNSGVDPELLAGQDRQQSGPPPATPCANLWLAAGTLIVEAGGPMLANAGGVAGLASLLRASRTGNLLGKSSQSPRALVVCVDIGEFLKADASTAAVAAAKRIRAAVGDAAQVWSSRMPMYVLFTKMDRVGYFSDYVRNLSIDEAGRVFGFTLPITESLQPGIYNQEQAQRLNTAFDELFISLVDSRQEILRREDDLARTPNTFEHPREFRKLRDDLVRFLVELGRPSQLQATPFLRGFYFTGVRPVTVAARGGGGVGGAAGAGFAAEMYGQPGQAAYQQQSVRRVPQWVFLRGFFTDALLADKLAFQTAGANTGASTVRNVLLGAAAALSALWLGGATNSYLNNRDLARTAREAASAAAPLRPGSIEQLRALDQLREPAAAVSAHMRSGAPASYRWGVYPGAPLQDAVRETYCRQLRVSLLNETQQALSRRLAALPLSPGPNDNYDIPYRDLKAYLILTSNPERSDPAFLGPALADRWAAARGGAVSADQRQLAEKQFRFFGAEHGSGYCGARAEAAVVATARAYLNRFPLVDRVYRSMVDEVNRQGAPIRFIDPTNAMTAPREVGFAYTKGGFPLMKTATAKAVEYLDREQWVLGQGARETSTTGLIAELITRYQNDFTAQWNAFVDSAAVTPYRGLKDASTKLGALASATSPMAHLFCLVSVNTQVENPEIARAFQPFQGFAPPATCATAASGPGNQQYMQGLAGLHVGVERIANAPNPDAERLTEADSAKMAAMTTAQQLNLGPKPAQLLKDPILYAEGLLKGVPAASANGKGAGFCAEIRPLLSRFPFNPMATAEVQPGELASVFAPNTGRLFTFQQEALGEFLIASIGGRFIAKTDARVPVNPAFVGFFNKAAMLSRLYYSAGAQIRVPFTLQVAPSAEIESVVLQIGSKTLKAGSGGGRQDFVWPEDAGTVRLQVRAKDVVLSPAEFSGAWAVTRLFANADETSSTGSQGSALFRLKTSTSLGRATTARTEVPLRINIDMKQAPLTLLPRDQQLGCVGTIALK